MTTQLPISKERLADDELFQLAFYAGEASCHPDPNYALEFQKLAHPANVLTLVNEVIAHRRALLAAYEQEPVANDASETLQKICSIFRIGIQAQTQSTILANVENCVRFAEQLHAIEREFFMVPGEPDEDYPDDGPVDVCLVNCWGSTTERYVEQFREALLRITNPAPVPAMPEIDRRAIADKVYGKCSRLPGATFYNAAEFAIDEVEACRAAMLNGGKS